MKSSTADLNLSCHNTKNLWEKVMKLASLYTYLSVMLLAYRYIQIQLAGYESLMHK